MMIALVSLFAIRRNGNEQKKKSQRIKIETKRGQWNETSTQKKCKWKLNKKGMNVDSKAKK